MASGRLSWLRSSRTETTPLEYGRTPTGYELRFTSYESMSQEIIVYGNEMCPMVPPVRDLLERASAPYTYISITRNGEARARVQEINRGNASVPTLVFPDGSTLTEPKLTDLSDKLQTLGYTVRQATLLDRITLLMQDRMISTLGIIFLAIGVLGNQPSMTVAGAVLLAVMALGMVLKRVRR